MTVAPSNNLLNSKIVLLSAGGLIALTAVVYFLQAKPGYIDFLVRGRMYRQIVDALASSPLGSGEIRYFKVNEKLDPKSLKPESTSAGSSSGTILVKREADGSCWVWMITVDNYHAGFGGYLFSNRPKATAGSPPRPDHDDGSVYTKLNDNWWSFYNN